MGTKRIILEIEEGLHKRIKDFAAKDKRTLTVVLRIMTEEMLEKLISEKETLLNSIVNNTTSVIKDKEVTTSLTDKELTDEKLNAIHGRTLSDFELNKIRTDPNFTPAF